MKTFSKCSMIFVISVSLTGCGAAMKDVMKICDTQNKFNLYVSCIKETYNRDGKSPDSLEVLVFYDNLNAITEQYDSKKITNAQAKSYAYDAFIKTVQASNDRNDADFMNYRQNRQIRQPIRTPIQTNCYRTGVYTNCTSY